MKILLKLKKKLRKFNSDKLREECGIFGISNHEDARGHSESHGIPYFHIPVTGKTKPLAEQRLKEVIGDTKADLNKW